MRAVMCGIALMMLSAGMSAQSGTRATPPAIPAGATELQGSPTVKVETSADETTRQALTTQEAKQHDLDISVINGRYYWTSRQNEELTVRSSDGFIYLTSATPGQYVRLSRVNDRVTYVEHLDMGGRSVTYFGELRIVLGK